MVKIANITLDDTNIDKKEESNDQEKPEEDQNINKNKNNTLEEVNK